MKHVLLTPETCPCDKNDYERDCPVCDWALNVCSVCGGAEADLIDDDGKENECPGPKQKFVPPEPIRFCEDGK
jgi:hypothetical protein